MAIEKIEVVIDKADCMPPDDGDDETSNNDPEVCDLITLPGMGRPNRDLEVTAEWEMFPTPVLDDDDDGGDSDVMLGQGR